METRRIFVAQENGNGPFGKQELAEGLAEAARLLRQGEVVAFPTETVYGLGANALDPRACARIFQVKGRPADNPLIVHVASLDDARKVVREWPEGAEICAREFWPGPLTLVLPKAEGIPDTVSGGLDTVGVRMPAHPVALALIAEAGCPVAAPSANISGKPSPTEGEHVWQDLQGKIPLIIDGGKSAVGLESTVLDLSGRIPTILRPGGITLEQLRDALGEVELDQGIGSFSPGVEPPKSPGMKYRHYAPRGEVILLKGNRIEKGEEIRKRLRQESRKRIALICFQETLDSLPEMELAKADVVFSLGSVNKPEEAARRLFEGLRLSDTETIGLILAEGMPETGIGLAFMNRLQKAAGKKNFTRPTRI